MMKSRSFRPLQGQCYVMTANLDGETSLKTKEAASMTKECNDHTRFGRLLVTLRHKSNSSTDKSTPSYSYPRYCPLFNSPII